MRISLTLITPTYEFYAEVINRLKHIKAIVIHPDTDFEFIEITDYDNGKYKYYPYQVKWALNVKSNDLNNSLLIESLINPQGIWMTRKMMRYCNYGKKSLFMNQ